MIFYRDTLKSTSVPRRMVRFIFNGNGVGRQSTVIRRFGSSSAMEQRHGEPIRLVLGPVGHIIVVGLVRASGQHGSVVATC